MSAAVHVIPTSLAESLLGRLIEQDEAPVTVQPATVHSQLAPCGAALAEASVVSTRVLRQAPMRFTSAICWSCVLALLPGEKG